MSRLRALVAVVCVLAGSSASAQVPVTNGWSSFGVLPFRGVDFIIVPTPTRYVLYYTPRGDPSLPQNPTSQTGRAYSTDLRSWTVDSGNVCATSGDLCQGGTARAGVLVLPDGRFRMFRRGQEGMRSLVSSDGWFWTLEPGVRLAPNPSSIYERGSFALALASFVWLPDGSVRMYYEGGVTPGSADTPEYYDDNTTFNGVLLVPGGMILSAISRDNGLTWTREAGVRINPLVQGPVLRPAYRPDGSIHTRIDAADLTAVPALDVGPTAVRIFAPSWDGAMSYISSDGVSFVLESQIPADRGDPKAIILPDGRTWVVTNQYPDGINDTIVYGPQSLFLSSPQASVTIPPRPPYDPGLPTNAFRSVTMAVTGTAAGPVTLQAIGGSLNCATCEFHPEYYSFTPASGTPPFTTTVTYTGPDERVIPRLVVHAVSGDTRAVGLIRCMDQPIDRYDTSVFCRSTTPTLPMNAMTFNVGLGAAPSSQVSDILSLGGPRYPFTLSSSVPWATASAPAAIAPAPITVTVDPAGLQPGTYSGTVTVSAEGTTEQIGVTMTVSPLR